MNSLDVLLRGTVRRFSSLPRANDRFARASKIFQPWSNAPHPVKEDKDGKAHSKSHKLLVETGLILPASAAGTFHLLPLFVRSLEKLIRLIDYELQAIGCQKLSMPSLMDAEMWKMTHRWQDMGNEMIKFADREQRDCCLGPTHEEPVTTLLTSAWHKPSYKKFPLRLYQITSKFRDEMKPRHGLLRTREFLMKDLYTFDTTEATAREGYQEVCSAYERIFKTLQLNVLRVSGDSGSMGGKESQEFVMPCETVGEDTIKFCKDCSLAFNEELEKENQKSSCPKCSGSVKLESMKAIEVAHAFILGDFYSKKFKAQFIDSDSQSKVLQMACFGIGVTRLVAAALEVQSTAEKLIWPIGIAPYTVCVISPKAGSNEARSVGSLPEQLAADLADLKHLADEVILDDRDEFSIGKRLNDATKVGYPVVVVVGKKATEEQPKFEIVFTHDTTKNTEVSKEDLMAFFTV